MNQENNKKFQKVEKEIDFYSINLWNSDSKIGSKTKLVLKYIEQLNPYDTWDLNQHIRFDEIIKTALAQKTPDGMLEVIGYVPKQRPTMYDKINRGG